MHAQARAHVRVPAAYCAAVTSAGGLSDSRHRAVIVSARPISSSFSSPSSSFHRRHHSRRRAAVTVTAAASQSGDTIPTVDYKGDEFDLPDAPVKTLIPSGAWRVIDGGVCAPKGFRAAAFKASLRATGTRADCALVVADEPAVSAGVFTQNRVAAAPVMYCKDVMKENPTARAVLVNLSLIHI